MKGALAFAAVRRGGLGLALLIVPSLVGQLLPGKQLAGVAIPVTRVCGIALIALGIACWPGPPLAGSPRFGIVLDPMDWSHPPPVLACFDPLVAWFEMGVLF